MNKDITIINSDKDVDCSLMIYSSSAKGLSIAVMPSCGHIMITVAPRHTTSPSLRDSLTPPSPGIVCRVG